MEFNRKACPRVSLIILISVLNLSTISSKSQIDDDSRGLRPREYAKHLSNKIIKKRPPSSQPKRQPPAAYVAESSSNTLVADGMDVGVTFWRLPGAESERIVERREVPKRAAVATAFTDGDMMWIGIEAPFEAYLYIINRERYRDRKYSDPYLIFPSEKDVGTGDKVYPGKIIMIPQHPDHFTLTRLGISNSEKVAEVFTFILTPQRLTDLPPLEPQKSNRKLATSLFKRWESESSGQLWKFSLNEKKGNPMTDDERIANRVTQDSVLPQDVYHVRSKPGDPIFFTVSVPIHK